MKCAKVYQHTIIYQEINLSTLAINKTYMNVTTPWDKKWQCLDTTELATVDRFIHAGMDNVSAQVLVLLLRTKKATISLIYRALNIDYDRLHESLDKLLEDGYISQGKLKTKTVFYTIDNITEDDILQRIKWQVKGEITVNATGLEEVLDEAARIALGLPRDSEDSTS